MISNLNKLLLISIIYLSLFFLNPFYVLLLVCFFELFIKISILIFIILGFLIGVLLSSREVGSTWGEGALLGRDDSLEYISHIDNIFNLGFFDYVINIPFLYFNGQEPGYYLLIKILSFPFTYTDQIILLLSVTIPIISIFYIIAKSFRFPGAAITALIFISAETLHLFFHLWRFSFASVFIIYMLFWYERKNKVFAAMCAALCHILAFIPIFLYFRSEKIESSFDLFRNIRVLVFNILYIFLFLLIFIFFIYYIDSNKILYLGYQSVGGDIFEMSSRQYFQLAMALILLVIRPNNLNFHFLFLAIIILLVPIFIDVTVIYVRVMLIFTPLITLFFCKNFESIYFRLYIFFISLYSLFSLYSISYSPSSFYHTIMNGSMFSPYNGLLFLIINAK